MSRSSSPINIEDGEAEIQSSADIPGYTQTTTAANQAENVKFQVMPTEFSLEINDLINNLSSTI